VGVLSDDRNSHFVYLHLRDQIPKDERVLIFVQFPDLTKKLAEALTAHHIKFLEIKGSATQKSNNLEKFQNDSVERVLLLNVMDESASGANLTSANHAIFLSPLLAPTQEMYNACETQAIGRLVRYGQTRHVYIWKFLTQNTIDEEIYRERKKGKQLG
jgi:SNF2 family DNA or RNA helicase